MKTGRGGKIDRLARPRQVIGPLAADLDRRKGRRNLQEISP